MSENAITLGKLQQTIDIFNSEFPRPGLGKLELSDAVRVNDKNTPWPNCTMPGVYVMFNAKEEVVYIGKASCNTNLGRRLGAHFKVDGTSYQNWSQEVTHVRTIPVLIDHAFEAPAIEEYLIQQLNPPLNVTGKKDN